MTHLFASHLRLDSLFFGVAISYLYHFHTGRFIGSLTRWRWYLIVGGMLLLTPAFVLELDKSPFIFTIGLTIFYIGSGMLLVGVLLCDRPRGRLIVIAATLGAYSYSIYLWHLVVGEWWVPWVERACGESSIPLVQRVCKKATMLGFWIAIYLIGSLILGVIMAKIIEVPALRLRDRWFPRRAEGPIEDLPPNPNKSMHGIEPSSSQ